MVGEILDKNKLIIGTHVGEGTGKVGGKTVEYTLTTSLNFSPSVRNTKTGKTFILSWEDIVGLAEKAGLFEEEESTNDKK